jgi:thiopeptide-type bacteriocin biosynthesis protein
LRESFEREFHVDASFRRSLAERFRPRREVLIELLTGNAGTQRLVPQLAILDRRTTMLTAPLAELRKRAGAGELSVSWEQLAISFVHMYINRLVRSAQRAHELVIYFFLERLYDSRLARSQPSADGADGEQERI